MRILWNKKIFNVYALIKKLLKEGFFMSSLGLAPVQNQHATFKLIECGVGGKPTTHLECNLFAGDKARYIGVKVLNGGDEESLPLTGRVVNKRHCWQCCASSWVDIEVIIGGQRQYLSVDVTEIAKKWGLDARLVKQKCQAEALEQLAQLANEALEDRQGDGDSSPVDLRQAVEDCDLQRLGVESDTNDLVHQPKKARTSNERAESKEDEGPEKTTFEKFPFTQLCRFFVDFSSEGETAKLVNLLQKEWPGIDSLIKTTKDSWKAKCVETGALNLVIRPNPHSSLHIEYFFGDDSVWIHFNCNQTPLALNLTKGVLCRRIAITKEQAEKLTQIQKLSHRCPYIESHTVSAFTSGSAFKPKMLNVKAATSVVQKEMFRVMTPFFGMTMQQALKDSLIEKEERDRLALNWLKGLEALHAADMAHFGICPEALLIEADPLTQETRGTIGGFSRAFFASQPPAQLIVTGDFHKAMPPECRENDAWQQYVKVPENAKAVDIYQIGSCLRELYADLFVNAAPLRPAQMAFMERPRGDRIRYIIEQMLNPDPSLLRISAARALQDWKDLTKCAVMSLDLSMGI